MKKVFAGVIALSIIPTPSFSGEVEVKEIITLSEQLLPQIGEKYNLLDKKEKKAYKKALSKYLKEIEKNGATGVSENFSCFQAFKNQGNDSTGIDSFRMCGGGV